MKMFRKIYVGIVLFVLPTWLARFLLLPIKDVRLSHKARVGFSVIFAEKIDIGDDARIGMFNIIICSSLVMKAGAVIRHFNFIKGIFNLEMSEKTEINRNTTIVNSLQIPELRKAYSIPTLKIGLNSIIGVKHFLDMTASVTIGENSILAGRSSELWTHAFYHQHKGSGRYMIRGKINIGNNCYIGSHVIFNCGVNVADTTTVAAGAIVSKDIMRGGIFCAQPLRHLDFEPDAAVRKYKKIDEYHYEKE